MTRDMATATAVAAVANQIDERATRIRVGRADWVRLLQQGVIVHLRVSWWRASVKLTDEDLGLVNATEEERAITEQMISLGRKHLLPPETIDRIRSIEESGRGWLKECAYTTHWGCFVPATAYKRWKERNLGYRVRFEALADEIEQTWPILMEQVRLMYTSLGWQAWRRLSQAGVAIEPAATWVPDFVERVMTLIPDAGTVRQSMRYGWDLEFVPLPSLLAEDAVAAERTRQEQSVLQEMEQDVRAAANRQKDELITTFMRDVQGELRGRIYDVAVDALTALRKGGRINGRSATQLRNLVETVASLKFWPDEQIDQQIAAVRTLLDSPAKDRSTPTQDLEAVLQEIGAEARLTLIELDRVPRRSGRDVGIPDDAIEIEQTLRQRRASTAPAPGDDPALELVQQRQGRRLGPATVSVVGGEQVA